MTTEAATFTELAAEALRLARPHVASIASYTLGGWTDQNRAQRIMDARIALRRIDEVLDIA